jgi:hypothetical protein
MSDREFAAYIEGSLPAISSEPVARLVLQIKTRGHFIVAEAAEMAEQLNQNRHPRPMYRCTLGRFIFVVTALIFPAAAGCQNLPSLDVLLGRLDAYAKQYQAALPSLSCDEQITSQALNKKGKVTTEVKAQSTLREVRTENPYAPFHEERDFKSINGHRPGRTSPMPYFVEGGFASLVGFKRWEQRECFDYVLTSGDSSQTVLLIMTLKRKFTTPSCARLPAGFHRIIIADPETGRIVHTERTIAPEAAAADVGVYFGAIDYQPQKIGEQEFWLPSHFYSHDATGTGRMSATYSNCHRYLGELKILPSVPSPLAGQGPR